MAEQIWPATEPAVYKNPHDITTYDSVAGVRYQVKKTCSDGAKNTYNASDWDMEVTFTRKAREIGVGDLVKHLDYPHTWRVLAVHSEWAWVVPSGTFGAPETRLFRDLRRAA